MKPKLTPQQHCRPVRYRYTSNGVTCTGHTVIIAGTHAALRREFKKFFALNPHIQPAEAA